MKTRILSSALLAALLTLAIACTQMPTNQPANTNTGPSTAAIH